MNDTIASYGSHPLQNLRIYHFDKENDETLLFIHGGAWRDPNNTYNDFEDMVGYIRKRIYPRKINLIGINYRLSPEIKHPYHLWDILEGIRYLVQNYGIGKLLIAGHSVGATLMLQLLNYDEILDLGIRILSDDITADKNADVGERTTLLPLNEQRTALTKTLASLQLRKLYFIDGIYDMVQLVSEYGGPYESFVNNAFTSRRQYAEASQLSSTQIKYNPPFMFNISPHENLSELQFIIIQSVQDELLSKNQTLLFELYLTTRKIKHRVLEGKWGEHEHVYRHEEVASIIVDSL